MGRKRQLDGHGRGDKGSNGGEHGKKEKNRKKDTMSEKTKEILRKREKAAEKWKRKKLTN